MRINGERRRTTCGERSRTIDPVIFLPVAEDTLYGICVILNIVDVGDACLNKAGLFALASLLGSGSKNNTGLTYLFFYL